LSTTKSDIAILFTSRYGQNASSKITTGIFMPFIRRSIYALLFTACSIHANGSQVTIIHAGKLLAVPGDGVSLKKTIVIKDGVIADIKSGYLTAKALGFNANDVQVVNQKDNFVMPGLIDLHSHITGERNPSKNRHQWLTEVQADEAYNAIPYLHKTLQAGFTTIRDLGGDHKLLGAIKRAVAKGVIEGPSIIAATRPITPTGGHGDFHGYRTEVEQAFEASKGVCDGPADCTRAVRALIKQGADVIKITATGGVLSNTNAGVGQQLTDEELSAVVKTAHSLGRKVAAHAHAADGINAALRAGVDSIEHGSYLNNESVKLFKKTGAYLVPTLMAGVSVSEEMSVNPNIPAAIVEKINMVLPAVEKSFKRALKAKVNIAFGTDSGVSKHGLNAREFELMVQYGMGNEAALQSATVNAAKLLGKLSTIGTIEKGKQADIIAIEGNPLKDIKTMHNIGFVMKSGEVFKR
jgi:imidazolonepropionase-like amidohydrolase